MKSIKLTNQEISVLKQLLNSNMCESTCLLESNAYNNIDCIECVLNSVVDSIETKLND